MTTLGRMKTILKVLLLGSCTLMIQGLSSSSGTSIVTGANGFVGREVVQTLLLRDHDASSPEIICLVRPARVQAESEFYQSHPNVCVLPYEMNDGGSSLEAAIRRVASQNEESSSSEASSTPSIHVYHVASVFGPTEHPIQTAHENVAGTEDVVRTLARAGGKNCRLVLTSSMAAVRGMGQEPLNGKYYTYEDWNTVSKLDADNWGSCYQWSKAQSEKRAWELSRELGVPMASICPSFVFGPGSLNNSFSVKLVDKWIKGKSPVQSRLCVDIRVVARAHVEAATRENAMGKRFLVTTEARVSSEDTAVILKKACHELGMGHPEKIHFDSEFQGGAIPIGEKEVDAEQRLKEFLGVSLISPLDTMYDMAMFLLVGNNEPATQS